MPFTWTPPQPLNNTAITLQVYLTEIQNAINTLRTQIGQVTYNWEDITGEPFYLYYYNDIKSRLNTLIIDYGYSSVVAILGRDWSELPILYSNTCAGYQLLQDFRDVLDTLGAKVEDFTTFELFAPTKEFLMGTPGDIDYWKATVIGDLGQWVSGYYYGNYLTYLHNYTYHYDSQQIGPQIGNLDWEIDGVNSKLIWDCQGAAGTLTGSGWWKEAVNFCYGLNFFLDNPADKNLIFKPENFWIMKINMEGTPCSAYSSVWDGYTPGDTGWRYSYPALWMTIRFKYTNKYITFHLWYIHSDVNPNYYPVPPIGGHWIQNQGTNNVIITITDEFKDINKNYDFASYFNYILGYIPTQEYKIDYLNISVANMMASISHSGYSWKDATVAVGTLGYYHIEFDKFGMIL